MTTPGIRRAAALAAAWGVLALAPGVALAQQATIGRAAPQPGEGRFQLREALKIVRFDDFPDGDDREAWQLTAETNITLGLTGDLALSATLPATIREIDDAPGGNETVRGFGDLELLARWRVVQEDLGPVDTLRVVVFGGAELPTGRDRLTSDSVDPIAGVAGTLITGRHGFNLAASWKFTTGAIRDPFRPGDGLSDLLRYDAAYLYRLSPEAYTSDTTASFYAMLELNGWYETNGDHEIMVSPGLLYEATTWAAEIAVSLPILSDLDERPERKLGVTLGIRFLF